MSSHWEWVENVMAEHDLTKPFAPENGQPLQFKVGDRVIYTNPAGIDFLLSITGLYLHPKSACGLYANGARYLLDWACHWYPVQESRLRLANSEMLNLY